MSHILHRPEMVDYLVGRVIAMPIGTEMHTNHKDCPAGEDKKKRLYIKRTSDAYLFYCHHCGGKGYYRTVDRLHRASEIITPYMPTKGGVHGTDDFIRSLNEGRFNRIVSKWPTEARIWWYSYGFTDEDAECRGVQWDDSSERLWLRGNEEVWQGRSFIENMCKYLTVTMPDAPVVQRAGRLSEDVVICEDLLSMYKIDKADVSVMCLMGTKIAPAHVSAIVDGGYRNVFVWLDDDEAGWLGTVEARKALLPLMHSVLPIDYYQPKEVTCGVIRDKIALARLR